MTDAPVVHIGENSPEQVAYRLLERIADLERKSLHHLSRGSDSKDNADRKWVLDTYAECLTAARGFRHVETQD